MTGSTGVPDAILNIIPGNDEVVFALRIDDKSIDSIDNNAYCTIIAGKPRFPLKGSGSPA